MPLPSVDRFGAPTSAPSEAGGHPTEDAPVGEGASLPSLTGQTLISRRGALRGGLAGLAGVGGLLLFPGQLLASQIAPRQAVNDSFVILLKGLYQPVVDGPNLGLSTVDLNDGSYQTTKIYPVAGTPGSKDPNTAIGDFYVGAGDLCAYHIPGGSFVMQFVAKPTDTFPIITSDGNGGEFWAGTASLKIREATGIYRSFVGGDNLMVDNLHFLASGAADEYCFCNISRP